jgi:hypothetical protein
MYFQLRYITTDFDFEGQEISTSDSSQKMIFVLRKRVPQDAERPPMEPMDGFATVTCERDLAARLHEEAISSGMLSIKKGAVRQMHLDMYSFMLHAIRLIR